MTKRTIAWMLLMAVFVVVGATTGSAVAHDLMHAGHHSAGMHSTGICAWMCAASVTVGTVPMGVSRTLLTIEIVPAAIHSPIQVEPYGSLNSRAPPSPLFP